MLERSERAESALPTGRGRGALIRHFFLGGLLYRLILKEVRGDFCRLRDRSFLVEIDKAVRECHLNTSSKLPSYTG